MDMAAAVATTGDTEEVGMIMGMVEEEQEQNVGDMDFSCKMITLR